MNVPLFNYTVKLFYQVEDAGILFSEQSILKLKCLNGSGIGSEEKRALDNFKNWKIKFVNNCKIAFYKDDLCLFAVHRLLFEQELLNCLFVAELFDWLDFNALTEASCTSFFEWRNGQIVFTRRLENLLAQARF